MNYCSICDKIEPDDLTEYVHDEEVSEELPSSLKHKGQVAQMVERLVEAQKVGGSEPSLSTI